MRSLTQMFERLRGLFVYAALLWAVGAQAALLTIGPDASFVPRELMHLPASTPVSATSVATLGDGSIGFNGGLAYDATADLFYVIGSDGFANSGLYAFTLAGAGAGTVTAIGSSFGQGFVNASLALLPGDGTPVPEPPTVIEQVSSGPRLRLTSHEPAMQGLGG